MAEQYLINDTTLTSIADAIRETGWPARMNELYGLAAGYSMISSFRYNSSSYYCLWPFLPATVYNNDGSINVLGLAMPEAIRGILGVPDLAGFVAREPLSGVVTLGEGITKLRSYAFATSSSYALDTNSVYENINIFVMRNVTYIGDSVFQNCSNLRSLYMFGSVVPSLGTYWSLDFSSQFNGTVWVPSSMYSEYINNSQWNPSYHPPSISSFCYVSDLGIRFISGSIDGRYAGLFNSSVYSSATYGNQYLIEGTALTAIASAIRGQLGVSTQYLPREMPSAIRQIGANDADMISNIEGTIQSYSDRQSSVYAVSDYAFACCYDLSSVVLPVCTEIGRYAFLSCSSLQYASAPQITVIESRAFSACRALSQASFSRCTSIGEYAFQYCSSLQTASFPECSWIGNSAFYSDTQLTSVSFPKCAIIDNGAFIRCAMSTISLPECSRIENQAFQSCSSLMSVYLLGSSVAYLGHSNAFSGTPILSSGLTGSFGSIFVPSSLYDSYYTSYTWSNYFRSRLVSM